MATDYIAIDCGKYNTKTNSFDGQKEKKFAFRTKFSEGTFDDDMVGKGSYIVQIDDGPVYKVGYKGHISPDMEDTKKTDIHRICSLAACAIALGDGDHPDVHAAIGMPVSKIDIVKERKEYKDFIFGEEGVTHTVVYMGDDLVKHTITFCFTVRNVYPEGIGVVYEHSKRCGGQVGVIDIGNLNVNALYVNNGIPEDDMCFTDKGGGNEIMDSLANELTRLLGSTVTPNIVAQALLLPTKPGHTYEDRHLITAGGRNKAVEAKSKEIIDRELQDHVESIKAKCKSIGKWPLDFMNLVFVGGTTVLLQKEIRECFGENCFIPEDPAFENASGFLKLLCWSDGIRIHEEEKAKKD